MDVASTEPVLNLLDLDFVNYDRTVILAVMGIRCNGKTPSQYRARCRDGMILIIIYIIIRHCPGVGAFPRPFCVPNSVALASLTLQVGDWAIH